MINAVESKNKALPCIKIKSKWFNTLSKKYVTPTYAKRINNYYIKHKGKGTLIQARGHYKYVPREDEVSVGIGEQSKEIKELYYSKGTQVKETIDMRGKKVTFAPLTRKIVKKETKKRLKGLDFTTDEGVSVELYKMTRNKDRLYHILTYDVNETFNSPNELKKWYKDGWHIINTLIATTKSVIKNRPIGHMRVYARVSMIAMKPYEQLPFGVFLGFVIPNRTGYKIIKEHFQEKVLDLIQNKLEKDAYKWFRLTSIIFYVFTEKTYATDSDIRLAKLRLGVLKSFR